jgi:hypothetical protein
MELPSGAVSAGSNPAGGAHRKAYHASRVDAGQHLDRVACPGGDLGGRDARVEPPGDPGVGQVVRALHQRRGELLRGEAAALVPAQVGISRPLWIVFPTSGPDSLLAALLDSTAWLSDFLSSVSASSHWRLKQLNIPEIPFRQHPLTNDL